MEYSAVLSGAWSSQRGLLYETAPIKLVQVCNHCLRVKSGVGGKKEVNNAFDAPELE
jgi:hypothetical protein